MILLDRTEYHKVTGPLREVTINNLFARSVVEKHVTGIIHVDDRENPKTFHIVHPYCMSLLFGATGSDQFNASFVDYALNTSGTRNQLEWLQVFPVSWENKMDQLFGNHLVAAKDNVDTASSNLIEVNTRVNFRFNPEKYRHFKSGIDKTKVNVVRTGKKLFEAMNGSVVPKHFWDNAADFDKNGFGYSLIHQHELVSTAFSSYVHDDKLELGIETVESVRGKGFASYTCAALIDYCLDNRYEPVWSCRLENTGSYLLAQKLGFEPTLYIPYYRLSI